VRSDDPAECFFHLFAELLHSFGCDLFAEIALESNFVGGAQDDFGQLLLFEGDVVFPEKISPLAKMKRVAVNQDAIHIKDDRGGEGRVWSHSVNKILAAY
jgi:hypothetical protein